MKAWGPRIGLLVAAGLASFSLAEGVVRWLYPAPELRGVEDLDIGWVSGEYKSFDPRAVISRPGQQRILFLGDSLLLSAGFPSRGERLQHHLAKMLATRR